MVILKGFQVYLLITAILSIYAKSKDAKSFIMSALLTLGVCYLLGSII